MQLFEISRNRSTVEVYVCKRLMITKYFRTKPERNQWIRTMTSLLSGVDELYFVIRHHYSNRSTDSINKKREMQKHKRSLLKIHTPHEQ